MGGFGVIGIDKEELIWMRVPSPNWKGHPMGTRRNFRFGLEHVQVKSSIFFLNQLKLQ